MFEIEVIGERRDTVLARIAGVADRNAAQALRGTRLYVPRAALPPADEDEYYHSDLLGLSAELEDGAPLGTVTEIRTVGETEVLEITRDGDGAAVLVPFTRDAVPVVNLAERRIVVAPPAGLIEQDDVGDGEDGA